MISVRKPSLYMHWNITLGNCCTTYGRFDPDDPAEAGAGRGKPGQAVDGRRKLADPVIRAGAVGLRDIVNISFCNKSQWRNDHLLQNAEIYFCILYSAFCNSSFLHSTTICT